MEIMPVTKSYTMNVNIEEEINVRQLISNLWKNKIKIFSIAVVFFLIGVFHIRQSNDLYHISYSIGNSNASKQNNLERYSLNSQFSWSPRKFIFISKSQDVADILSKDLDLMTAIFSSEWNSQEQKFYEPDKSFKGKFKEEISMLLLGRNRTKYIPPDGNRLRDFINQYIKIELDIKTGFIVYYTISPYPELSSEILVKIVNATKKFILEHNYNNLVRQKKSYDAIIEKSSSSLNNRIYSSLYNDISLSITNNSISINSQFQNITVPMVQKVRARNGSKLFLYLALGFFTGCFFSLINISIKSTSILQRS